MIHKGWPVFQALAACFRDDPRYAFPCTWAAAPWAAGSSSTRPTGRSPSGWRSWRSTWPLVWPVCRETFGLIAYEAVAAGAAVLTYGDTGNVADFVADGPAWSSTTKPT